jgi:hypothetical protein
VPALFPYRLLPWDGVALVTTTPALGDADGAHEGDRPRRSRGTPPTAVSSHPVAGARGRFAPGDRARWILARLRAP